jgi:hypothetical protein
MFYLDIFPIMVNISCSQDAESQSDEQSVQYNERMDMLESEFNKVKVNIMSRLTIRPGLARTVLVFLVLSGVMSRVAKMSGV